jgi:histidinol phosphatase-like PHP family hydrolase
MSQRFRIDHDLHLHSQLSLCSNDPEQTADALLAYGVKEGLSDVCVTDHYWDENVPGASGWYAAQDYAHVAQILPLPQSEACCMHFGCEIDMDQFLTLGISEKRLDAFEFIIVPTSHLHMTGFTIAPEDVSVERRAALYMQRNHALLDMDLPFYKMGLAHFTCSLMERNCEGSRDDILDAITDAEFAELFARVAKSGMGVELNMNLHDPESERTMRPYRIAKAQSCKFYLGSDAHHPKALGEARARFEAVISALELSEDDKFRPFV